MCALVCAAYMHAHMYTWRGGGCTHSQGAKDTPQCHVAPFVLRHHDSRTPGPHLRSPRPRLGCAQDCWQGLHSTNSSLSRFSCDSSKCLSLVFLRLSGQYFPLSSVPLLSQKGKLLNFGFRDSPWLPWKLSGHIVGPHRIL